MLAGNQGCVDARLLIAVFSGTLHCFRGIGDIEIWWAGLQIFLIRPMRSGRS